MFVSISTDQTTNAGDQRTKAAFVEVDLKLVLVNEYLKMRYKQELKKTAFPKGAFSSSQS